ncbi:MAG TPA: hypothetical protein VLJ57_21105, partial [Burkholderiaceae bacterium]|nr:hypothetical protein [Burkholderiaceae bacterium]
MALDTTCPVCTAPHARKLSLVYEEGLSSAIVTTQSVGKANTIGAHKITTTGTSTQVQQTQLSQSAAPPPPVAALVSAGARARGNAILVAFVLALLVAFANGKGFLHGLLFFVMTFIVGIVLSV